MGLFIDKISGQVFLFDFTSSGGTGSGSTSAYPQVNTFSQLPSAATHNGKIYVVLQTTGTYPHVQEAGLYYSNGSTWSRIGDTTAFFSSTNFRVYDGVDSTKQIRVVLSGNTSGTTRVITLRNSNGTIAYLSDIPSIPSGNTKYEGIQVIDLLGNISVNNIATTPIIWSNVQFSGDSLNYSGGTRIYIKQTANYQISYNLMVQNFDNYRKTIGGLIRVNASTDVTPLSVISFIDNGSMLTGGNGIANYQYRLNAGDYIELYAFRIGDQGIAKTIPNTTWIRVVRDK